MAWEEEFLLYLQNNVRTEFLNHVMQFFSFLGNFGWFWIVLCIVLIAVKKTRPIGIIAATALVASLLIVNGIIKPVVSRTRPFVSIEELTLITRKPLDSSFPSGHTSSAFVVSCAITWCLSGKKKWIGVILIIIASLIAFSRLYLGAHYPTDVIAGLLLGITISVVTYFALRKKVLQKE
ncbi:MAG: phosphatase PAP2 family protein [Eubacterium sp.]|nr:phosphatase PAP2 family protein [Eubacterium sp.]MEE3398781.1 phosphatase PAP2 family protein [Eubacterium sp.]